MSLRFAPDSGIPVYEGQKKPVYYMCVKSDKDPSLEVRTTFRPSYLLYCITPQAMLGSHTLVDCRSYADVESIGGALASLHRHRARIAPPKWHLGPLYFNSERIPGSGPGPSFSKFFIGGLWELWLESWCSSRRCDGGRWGVRYEY